MRQDLLNNIDPVVALAPGAGSADNTAIVSSILDTAGFDSSMLVIIAGALHAGASFTVLLQHGNAADMSDATSVTAEALTEELGVGVSQSGITSAELSADFIAAQATQCFKLGYVGGKRYVRATITPAGGGATSYLAAVWLRGHPRNAPTPNPPGH